MIISGGRDGVLRLYDRFLQHLDKSVQGHHAMVRALQAQSYMDFTDVIVSGSYDGSVVIWTKQVEDEWFAHCLEGFTFTERAARATPHSPRVTSTTGIVNATLRSHSPSTRTRSGLGRHLRAEHRPSAEPPAMVFQVDMNERWLVCVSDSSSSICGWDYADRGRMYDTEVP
ncbi:hypothetical protein LTR54_018366, partial [Friedmanniomyces endolithicus]